MKNWLLGVTAAYAFLTAVDPQLAYGSMAATKQPNVRAVSLSSSVNATHVATTKTTPVWSPLVQLHTCTVLGQAVNYVTVNTTSKHMLVRPIVANNRFGSTASLLTLASASHSVAAINGTFFNTWSNQWVSGALDVNGSFEHTAKGTLFGITGTGQMTMTRGTEGILATVDTKYGPLALHPWHVNDATTNPSEIDILDKYYGTSTGSLGGTSLVVQNGKITAVVRGNVSIPRTGYVIHLGTSSYYSSVILPHIQVGESISLQTTVTDLNHNPVNFKNVVYGISAGPMLVNAGQVVLNPQLEGFTDPTIINSNTRRSLLGIDSSGHLVLATIHSATLAGEAAIAKKMGLKEAMNLDGGSSTGLVFNGHYVQQPGRSLATAIGVSYLS